MKRSYADAVRYQCNIEAMQSHSSINLVGSDEATGNAKEPRKGAVFGSRDLGQERFSASHSFEPEVSCWENNLVNKMGRPSLKAQAEVVGGRRQLLENDCLQLGHALPLALHLVYSLDLWSDDQVRNVNGISLNNNLLLNELMRLYSLSLYRKFEKETRLPDVGSSLCVNIHGVVFQRELLALAASASN
ncbi:hypothetical protein Ancab_015371 [Ancistrocladus abbreviatus]